MARLNIEDTIDADPRFRRLSRLLGDEDKALGMLVRFWRLAQLHWGQGLLVPEHEVDLDGFEPIVTAGLAERRVDGVYARGSEERFAWYRQRCEASARGVESRQRNAQDKNDGKAPPKPEDKGSCDFFEPEKKNRNPTSGQPEPEFRTTGTPNLTNPLTLTLSLTNNTKKLRSSAATSRDAGPLQLAAMRLKKAAGKNFTSLPNLIIAAYVEGYEERYGHAPVVSGKVQGAALNLSKGVTVPSDALDLVAAFLQLDRPHYVRSGHCLSLLVADLQSVNVALRSGKEDPARDLAWEKQCREFKKRNQEEGEEKNGQR